METAKKVLLGVGTVCFTVAIALGVSPASVTSLVPIAVAVGGGIAILIGIFKKEN